MFALVSELWRSRCCKRQRSEDFVGRFRLIRGLPLENANMSLSSHILILPFAAPGPSHSHFAAPSTQTLNMAAMKHTESTRGKGNTQDKANTQDDANTQTSTSTNNSANVAGSSSAANEYSLRLLNLSYANAQMEVATNALDQAYRALLQVDRRVLFSRPLRQQTKLIRRDVQRIVRLGEQKQSAGAGEGSKDESLAPPSEPAPAEPRTSTGHAASSQIPSTPAEPRALNHSIEH